MTARGGNVWRRGMLLFLGLILGAAAAGAAPCPPGLEAAARAYRDGLNAEQEAIRTSTPEAPAGVEETVFFELGAHACHRGPGQAYRVYGPPECEEAAAGGRAAVRYPYELFFRRALTLEELFRKPWQPGSDGILRVEFEREGDTDRWVPVGRREVLDLGDKLGR
ncbi:hypothetical protein [Deferrisoma sp.]